MHGFVFEFSKQLPCGCSVAASRGVTRLDGARVKKRFWHPPMFEAEVFWKQMYCIEESTCDIVGTFRPRDSSPRVLCPPSPLVTPLGATHHHQQCCSSQQGFVVLLQIALQSKSQPLHSVYSFPAFVLSLINEIPCRSVALLCEWYEPELPAFAYVEQACFWAFRELFRGSDWIGVSWFFFNPAK